MSAGSPWQHAPQESITVSEGVMQVKYGSGPSYPPDRYITAVEGLCPSDNPVAHRQTHVLMDRRLLLPFTIRYVAKDSIEKPWWVGEGEIQRGVWKQVRQVMEEEGWSEVMPSVFFDRDPLDSDKRSGCLDVVYSSARVWGRMMTDIKSIKLEKAGNKPWVMTIHSWSTSLEGNILPFDVLRLPVDSIDTKELLKCFNHMAMTAGVGSVIGFGSYKASDGITEPSQLRTDILRGYIKLHESSMTIPFATLSILLPTHFLWRGVPHTMYFAGRDHHKTPKHSANYPNALAADTLDGADTSSSASSGSSAASTESSSTLVDSSGNSNKRKRSGT